MEHLFISDLTLREAQKRTESALSFREKTEIAKLLDRLHVFGIELPQIQNEKVDTLLLKSIAGVVESSRVAIPCALSEAGVRQAWNAVKEAAHPCLQIAVPTSAVQMEYLCHKKPDGMLALAGELVGLAKTVAPEVEFVALDATRSERTFLFRAVEAAVAAGADIVTLCDSAGGMLPEEFSAFIGEVFDRVPGLSARTVGVQCADALHLAAACSVAAIGAGARLVKAAAGGDGLTQMTALADILRARGADWKLDSTLAMTELTRATEKIDRIMRLKRSASSPYDNSVQRETDAQMHLSRLSDRAEVASAVRRLGYELSEEDHARVFEAFGRIAAKKDVGDKELDAIVASAALQVPPAYTLDSYVINSGNVITATAHIKLIRQGRAQQGIAIGDGPIDASFLAIEQIVGHHYELDDFQIQAVTEGREAMGAALVRLRSGGKLYAGNGISTDIIGASISAYLSALNKIVYEEGARS